MKKIVWRLGKLPSIDELRVLVKDKIITQEEAREILFNQETEEDRDVKSLKEEIKFLREMIDILSKNQGTRVFEIIRERQPYYGSGSWYTPYNNLVLRANTVTNHGSLNQSGTVATLSSLN